MRIIFIMTFCLSVLPAQDHLDALIQNVLHGSRDSAAVYLPTMEQRYPNNPSLMYLKGLLENNGEEAMVIFSKLYNTHPSSEYGDDAVMKVAEYYYAAGMYVKAANWLKKMPLKIFPGIVAVLTPGITIFYMITALQTGFVITKYERSKFKDHNLLWSAWNPKSWHKKYDTIVMTLQLNIARKTKNSEGFQNSSMLSCNY